MPFTDQIAHRSDESCFHNIYIFLLLFALSRFLSIPMPSCPAVSHGLIPHYPFTDHVGSFHAFYQTAACAISEVHAHYIGPLQALYCFSAHCIKRIKFPSYSAPLFTARTIALSLSERMIMTRSCNRVYQNSVNLAVVLHQPNWSAWSEHYARRPSS